MILKVLEQSFPLNTITTIILRGAMAFQSKVNFFSGHPVVDPKMTGESENVNLNLASYCGNN